MRYLLLMLVFIGIAGCSNSNESYVDTNSLDYKYSNTRFRMEGYSDKDSETAARAIYKFNQAQKNRNR